MFPVVHFLQLSSTDVKKLTLFMLKSNLSARVLQVIIDLIHNDIWCVVVLHSGTKYLGVLGLLLDDLVYWYCF